MLIWSDDVFKKIGNASGLFYEADNTYREMGNMRMVGLLIGLDLIKGLVGSIIIRKGLTIFYQPLDYEEIPFNCGICQVHMCFAKECTLPI
jgi:hypothetical protein